MSAAIKTKVTILLASLLTATLPADGGNNVAAWGAGTIIKTIDNNDYGQSIIPADLTNAVQVSGGWRHSLALKADGTLEGWGDDGAGQINFPAASNYIAIACGRLHSLALQSNGIVSASAGDNYYGQASVPTGLSNVVAIACGWYHSLALKSDGTVVAWGANTGSDSNDYGQSTVPSGLSNVVAIAAGGWHSLALKADGTLTGWGRNDFSQAATPPGVSNVLAIAAGAGFSLALEANGHLVAWGDNSFGQTNVPGNLANNVLAIAAGSWHGLALKTNGTVVAWGASNGSNTNVDYGQTNVPAGVSNVIQIAAGVVNSLVLEGASPPRIKVPLTITGLGTNGFALDLPTQNGRVYQLEYKNAISDLNWAAFPLQPGMGDTNQFIDPGTANPQRFYRATRW